MYILWSFIIYILRRFIIQCILSWFIIFYILYSILCILYSIFCILYSVLYIMYSIFCILYSVFYISYSIFCILYSIFCIVYSVLYILYSIVRILWRFILPCETTQILLILYVQLKKHIILYWNVRTPLHVQVESLILVLGPWTWRNSVSWDLDW